MSNQAERIKAFKLAQHARLQKQDEEEQWISSEELCTEGSSDEESGNSGKRSQRKQKRNPHAEKRGISPLAQPPRDTNPTSLYQRDSKYLLPDAAAASQDEMQSPAKSQADTKKSDDLKSVDAKVEKLVLNRNKASTSKAASSSIESETDDEELEKMIQWRPKRGSLKLPEFPDGMPVEVPASESVN